MNQLTSLPADYDLRKLGPWFERTSQLRVGGTRSLIAAAQATGSARFVYQSIAFMYAPVGPRVVDEDAPLMLRAAEPLGAAVRATVEGERLAMTADGMTGVVLRYGQLYGPWHTLRHWRLFLAPGAQAPFACGRVRHRHHVTGPCR